MNAFVNLTQNWNIYTRQEERVIENKNEDIYYCKTVEGGDCPALLCLMWLQLKHWVQVWAQQYQDINLYESLQKRAIEMGKGLEGKGCEECLGTILRHRVWVVLCWAKWLDSVSLVGPSNLRYSVILQNVRTFLLWIRPLTHRSDGWGKVQAFLT